MKIKLKIDKCRHMDNLSVYNSNFYELPFFVNECNYLHIKYGGNEEFDYAAIGIFVDFKFKCKYYLNTELKDGAEVEDTIEFDSDTISIDNKFT